MRDGGGFVEVMRRGWIQLRDVDIFCFMFRTRQFNPYRGHKKEGKESPPPLLLCQTCSKGNHVTMCCALLGGTKENSHVGLMYFVKPLLTVEEIGTSSVLFIY